MGATQNIKQLFFTDDLTERICKNCSKFFTDIDYKNDNWDLEFRTNSNADFSLFRKGTSKGPISVIIELYHGDCPEVKEKHPQRADHAIHN